MRQRSWSRHLVIGEVRDRIWHHLPSSAVGSGPAMDAASLFWLGPADVERLAVTHWLLGRVSLVLALTCGNVGSCRVTRC